MSDGEIQDGIKFLREVLSRLLSKPKVLLVEDDELDLKLSLALLEQFECEPMVCRNGELAITMINSLRPDVVLLDMNIPRFSGEEVLQRTIGLKPEVNFIIVTAMADAPIVANTLKTGAIMAWQKPLTSEILERIFRKKPKT